MERLKEEVVFEYEGLTELLPMETITKKFVGEDYKIVNRAIVGGKHVKLTVFKKTKELIV